jgi:hypothetical protein
MKIFKLQIISKKPEKIYGLSSYWGKITIGDFNERFILPISNWNLEQYKQQWKDGFERLKTYDTTCFVTSVQNLDLYPSIEMWTVYKNKNKFFFHQQLLIDETAGNSPIPLKLFNLQTCYQFISPRITNKNHEAVNEEDEKISEWSIPAKDFFSSFES